MDYNAYRQVLLENEDDNEIKALILYFQRELFGPDDTTEPTTSTTPAATPRRQIDTSFRRRAPAANMAAAESPEGPLSGHQTPDPFGPVEDATEGDLSASGLTTDKEE